MGIQKNSTINKKIDRIYKKGNIQQAIELCQCEIAKAPNSPDTAELHAKLGDMYLEWHFDISQPGQQYVDEAITQYQQAMELNLKSEELYYKLGIAHFEKNDLHKAMEYLNKALSINENYYKAYFGLAKCYTERNELYNALAYAKSAVKHAPLFSAGYYLCLLLTRLSEKRSLKKLLKCICYLFMTFITLPFDKASIKNVCYMLNYVKYIPALIWAHQNFRWGRVERAIEIYKNIIEKAPRFAWVYEFLGGVYYSVNRVDEAICEFKMSIWINSLNINAYKSLRYIYERQEDYERAIDLCRKTIKIQPYDAENYSELAGLLYLSDNVEESISNYQNALTLGKDKEQMSNDALFLGYVFHKGNQNFDASIASYQLASVMNPNSMEIYVNLGNAFYDKGEYDNAKVVYRKALEIQPTNPKIHCNLGYLYWGCGVIDEAIKSYELAIQYDDNYAIAYNNLGVIYLDDLGRVQQAAELFENAIRSNPNYALAYYNLGRTKEIVSDKIEAAKLYQISYDLNKISNEMDPSEILQKIQSLFS